MCGRLGDIYWVGACGGQCSGMKSDSTADTRHRAPRWCYMTAIVSDLLGVRVGKRGANGVEGERCMKVCPPQAWGKPRRLWAQRRRLRVVRNPAHAARATAGRARRPAYTCRRLEAALCGAAYLGRAPIPAGSRACCDSHKPARGRWGLALGEVQRTVALEWFRGGRGGEKGHQAGCRDTTDATQHKTPYTSCAATTMTQRGLLAARPFAPG